MLACLKAGQRFVLGEFAERSGRDDRHRQEAAVRMHMGPKLGRGHEAEVCVRGDGALRRRDRQLGGREEYSERHTCGRNSTCAHVGTHGRRVSGVSLSVAARVQNACVGCSRGCSVACLLGRHMPASSQLGRRRNRTALLQDSSAAGTVRARGLAKSRWWTCWGRAHA